MDDKGHSFRIPRSRRLSWDLLFFNRSVPLCAHSRKTNFQKLNQLRSQQSTRISWPVIVMKAWSLVCVRIPQLRQTWYRWPVAHIHQHPATVGTLTIQREYRNEPWLFWGRFEHPAEVSLSDLQLQLDRYTTQPPQTLFKDQLRLSKLPTPIRRMIWWWNLAIAKRGRAQKLGTYFVSTLAGRQTEIAFPPSIHSTCLTYGPMNPAGVVKVTVAYDHRLFDGALAADALQQLDQILQTEICLELEQNLTSADC